MARKWVRINRLSVICLKASHSIKAICGRHEPKIKLLTVWLKVFERGTWHNQRGKVWVIGSSREIFNTFPWSAPSFFCCGHPSRKTPFRSQTRQTAVHTPPAPLIGRSPCAKLEQGSSHGEPQLSHSLFNANPNPGWSWYARRSQANLLAASPSCAQPAKVPHHKLRYGRKSPF